MLRPRGKALDLGTGCGTLALAAAPSAESVIGTDINRRALDFGRINAALNGVSNVSFLHGDRFEPVAGRRFDSIISNPPFFLAPVSGLLYCENSMELDGFVESLARSARNFWKRAACFRCSASGWRSNRNRGSSVSGGGSNNPIAMSISGDVMKSAPRNTRESVRWSRVNFSQSRPGHRLGSESPTLQNGA